MTSFFSTIFQDHLRDNPTFFDTPKDVAAVFLPMAPVFSEGDSRYTGTDADTIEELTALLGWEPPIHWDDPPVQEVTLPLASTASGSTRYVHLDNAFVLPEGAPSLLVRAVAFVYKGTVGGVTDPIIFVSNTPVGSSGLVLNPGDSITARPDTTTGSRWLFSYTTNAGPPASVTSVAGPLATLKAEPPFDASRTQHVWLYPQRVNLIANPSFEGGMTHWRSSGVMQQIDGAAPGGGIKSGQFSGGSPIIVESNMFPTAFGVRPKEMLTVRLNAKGNGRMKVALLSWMANFEETTVDWGQMPDPTDPTRMIDAEWLLSPEGFISVCSLRMTPEARYGMVRIEVEGDLLVLDNCLVEEGWVPAGQDAYDPRTTDTSIKATTGGTLATGFPYFDGDSLYGARDDYSWYGGEDCQGHTYSCWYNHRRSVVGRLFDFQTTPEDQAQPRLPPTWTFDPTMYMHDHWFTAPPARVLNKLIDNEQTPVFFDACDSTPTVIANQGFLPALTGAVVGGARKFDPEDRSFFWIPASAGNSLSVPDAANLDITTSMTVISEIAPASWTPPAEEVIASKWINAGITPGTSGYAVFYAGSSGHSITTPDSADLHINGDRVITFKVRFANDLNEHHLAAQYASGQYAWDLYVSEKYLTFSWSANGTTQIGKLEWLLTHLGLSFGVDVHLGLVIRPNVSGSCIFQVIRSTDGGVTWSNLGTPATFPITASFFNSTAPLRVGNSAASGDDTAWTSRFYWIQMRTGINPNAGTVVFRCDVNEKGPTENPWTDPRGRVWTAEAAGVTAGMFTAGGNGTPIANSWVFSVLPSGALQLLWGKPSPPPWESASFDQVASDENLTVPANTRHFVAFTFLNNVGGNAEIRFWHSDDGVSWTQLGATMTKPAFSLISGTARVEFTAQNNAEANRSMEAKFYTAKIYNSTDAGGAVATSDAAKVLEIDTDVLSSDDYGQPTFLAVTGQIVSVNRGTSGYISTMTPAMDKGGRHFFMLDGTNDYIEIANDAALNIPDDGDFIVVFAGRQKVMPKANSSLIQKVDTAAPNIGWEIATTQIPANVGSIQPKFKDATIGLSGAAQSLNIRKVPTSGGFRMTDNKVITLRDNAFTPAIDATVLGAVSNNVPVRIGRSRADVYETFDFFGMAILTQLLDDTELSNLAIALRDASDVYHHGDRWTVSEAGIFMGIPLDAGDVLVATHRTGAVSPMRFEDVIWDTEAEGGGVVTNVEIEKQGLVYKWLPSGLVVYHLDVLFPHDTRPCPPPVTGDPLPRDDVPDPWVPPPTPDTTPPTAPLDLRIVGFTGTQVDLAWDAATDNVGVVQYRLERAVGVDSTAFHQIFATAILTYSDIGLARGETYRYRVRAVDAAGNLGPYSNVVEATTEGPPSLWDEALWDEGFWEAE